MDKLKKDFVQILMTMIISTISGMVSYQLHIQGDTFVTMLFLGLTILASLTTILQMTTVLLSHTS